MTLDPELKKMAEQAGLLFHPDDFTTATSEQLAAFAAAVADKDVAEVEILVQQCHAAQLDPPTMHGMLLEITLADLANRMRERAARWRQGTEEGTP